MTRKPSGLIILVFLIVLPSFAQGWFDDKMHGRPFSTRRVVSPPESSGSLAVFDDIACGSEEVVMQTNPFFIPADTVYIDVPLTFLVKTPVSSMETLDRLMVANLRLKLLIEEYNALKKKADQLLKSVSIPYLDSPWITKEIKGDKSVDDRKKDLDTRLVGVFIDVPVGSKFQSSPGSLSSLGFSSAKTPGIADSLLPLSKISTSGQNLNIAPLTQEFVPLGPGIGSKDLPWIFSVFLKFSSYCLAHRLEAAAYGTILFSIGYLIALQARHGK